VQLVAKVFPEPEHVAEVIDIAEAFWKEHPDQHIAIHCAYGTACCLHSQLAVSVKRANVLPQLIACCTWDMRHRQSQI
jgi:predicted protein tyrosine phosphatase